MTPQPVLEILKKLDATDQGKAELGIDVSGGITLDLIAFMG
jgi:hypothetical protein